jgi:DNA invertase Pin-like site-specific DNA recombinase
MATYGYARVSTAEQAKDDRTSLQTQVRRIEGIAHAAEWTIDAMFVEAGVSGTIPFQERPEGGKLWATLQPGDNLITAKLDRLFRNATDALTTADHLKARGVGLILLDIGMESVTTGTSASRLFFGMLALMAEFERSRTRERIAENRAARRQRGGNPGGKVPFGYSVVGKGRGSVLVPNQAQQAAIVTAKALRAEGKSLRAIQAALHQQFGFKVAPMTVRAVVARDTAEGIAA